MFSVYDDDDDVSVKDMYKIDDVLGEGTFSVVYLAERKDQRDGLVAIKVIERQQEVRIILYNSTECPRSPVTLWENGSSSSKYIPITIALDCDEFL